MKKINITDLRQAEDRLVDFIATQEGSPIIDVTNALIELRDLDGNSVLRLTLGSGITFADSTFTIQLTDSNTAELVGKYNYEVWYLDSLNADVLVAFGSMKFSPTFGRFD